MRSFAPAPRPRKVEIKLRSKCESAPPPARPDARYRDGMSRALVFAVRYGIPAVLILAGLVAIVARDGDETSYELAAMSIGGGLAVLLLNVVFRFGAKGDSDRDDEDAARRYFDEHGHWPDEAPGGRP